MLFRVFCCFWLGLLSANPAIAQTDESDPFFAFGVDTLGARVDPVLRGAITAMEAGDYLSAVVELREIAARDTAANLQALRLMASAYRRMEDYVQSVSICEQISQIDSLGASSEVALGFLHSELGDFDSAEQHYLIALQRDPDQILAYQGLGWLLLQRGRLEQALDMVTETTERAPTYAPNYLLMGRVLTAQGFFEDAVVAYDRAFALRGDLREHYGILRQELLRRHGLSR